jgi:cytochrome b561
MRHDTATMVLHWTTFILVAALWIIGQTIDFAPSGALRVDYRSLHITLGVILGVVLCARLFWRLTKPEHLQPLDHGLLHVIAQITHWVLYGLMIVTVALGLTYVWVRGDMIFNLLHIPPYDPNNPSLRHLIGGWHALAANTILIVAGLHAAAALFHHFILRDETLRRMLPRSLS